ncbi:hypothetical protein DV735_g2566, partial [Chaetothyriales sp. CBS 134920]
MSSNSNDLDDSSALNSDSSVQTLKRRSLNAISGVKSPAWSFTTSGELVFAIPGIVFQGAAIPLPLSPVDAQRLIQASNPAPLGKDTETLINEPVRKTGEIDAKMLQFQNKRWEDVIQCIACKAAKELGVPGSNTVEAMCDKMLISGPGDVFQACKQ